MENSLQNGAIKKVFWEISIIVPHILKEYWSHFKAKKQGFQRRLNEVLETARTYVFQFRDNWTLILLSQNKSKASDWPTNQERPFKSGTIFTSKAYSSLSFEDREYFYSFYWPQRTWAEPLVEFYSKKFHPALKWAKNCFWPYFECLGENTTPPWILTADT